MVEVKIKKPQKIKQRLPLYVKRQIVIALAQFTHLSTLAMEIKKTFQLDVSVQALSKYDASKPSGNNLSEPLRKLFWETRNGFVENIEELPMANAAYRLRELNRQYERACESGKVRDAAFVLQIAQHEMRTVLGIPDEEAERFNADKQGAAQSSEHGPAQDSEQGGQPDSEG